MGVGIEKAAEGEKTGDRGEEKTERDNQEREGAQRRRIRAPAKTTGKSNEARIPQRQAAEPALPPRQSEAVVSKSKQKIADVVPLMKRPVLSEKAEPLPGALGRNNLGRFTPPKVPAESKLQEKASEEKADPRPGALGRDKSGRFTPPKVPLEKPIEEQSAKDSQLPQAATKTDKAPAGPRKLARLPLAETPRVPFVKVEVIADGEMREVAEVLASDTSKGKRQLSFNDVREATRALEEIAAGQTEFSNPAVAAKIKAKGITADVVDQLRAAMATNPELLASHGSVILPSGEVVPASFQLTVISGSVTVKKTAASSAAPDSVTVAGQTITVPEINHLTTADPSLLSAAVKKEIDAHELKLAKSGYARIYAEGVDDGKLYVLPAERIDGVTFDKHLLLGKQELRVVAMGDSNNAYDKAVLSVVKAFGRTLLESLGKKMAPKTKYRGVATEADDALPPPNTALRKYALTTLVTHASLVYAGFGDKIAGKLMELKNYWEPIVSTGGKAVGAAMLTLMAKRIYDTFMTRRQRSLDAFVNHSGIASQAAPRPASWTVATPK